MTLIKLRKLLLIINYNATATATATAAAADHVALRGRKVHSKI